MMNTAIDMDAPSAKGTGLPKGWRWTPLSEVADNLDNKRKPINAAERETRQGNVPYYGATGQVGWIDKHLLDEEVVLVGEDGAPFLEPGRAKAYMIAGKSWVNNHAHVLRAKDGMPNAYLMHFLNILDYSPYVSGTTRLKLTKGAMSKIPVPVAPLPQQRRIVSAIELQLGRLDTAVARLHGAKAKLKNYRLAALDAAFGGQLTGERLTTDGVPLGWKLELSGDLMPDINNGYTPTAEKLLTQGARPFIKVYNLTFTGALDYTLKPTFIDEETHSKGLKRSICYPGDVLINIVGPPLGKVSCVSAEYPEWNINQAIVRFRPSERITSRYLTYLMQSPRIIRWLTDRSRATAGQHNVRVTTCREIPMPVCDVAHQERVADAIDDQLNAHRAIEQTIDAQLERSTRLRQAVLKRAFEGRLG